MSHLFLDVETSGLDPNKDKILEIAWVLTDRRFNALGAPHTYLIAQDDADWGDIWSRIRGNKVVEEMHTKSNLIKDLTDPYVLATDLDDVYKTLQKDVEFGNEIDGKVHLTGRSVHFDKSFLLANDFGTLFDTDGSERYFHHQMLDLSSVRLLYSSADLEIPEADNLNPHRALSDVMSDVTLARQLVLDIQKVSA